MLKQPKMSHHLIFYLDEKVTIGVGCATIMWAEITYKTSYSMHVGIFDRLALLVLGGGSKCCSNLGAKFRSQYLSHMTPNLGGVLDKVMVVHNLIRWI